MNTKSSYNIQGFTTTTESEVNRLKAQVALFWDKEIRLYRDFGLVDGMDIIECGSGPGFFLENMLRTFPGLKVTGVEIDPYLVDISKKTLSDLGPERFEIHERSIMETGLPDNCFDFAFTRLVLEHLPDPVGAVKEISRVLKPNGKAVLIDNDFKMHLVTSPPIPELDELYEAYCSARTREGGNPRIGRELPGILKECGFSNISLELVCAHSQLAGDKVFLQSEGVGISSQLVKDGYLDHETLDVIAKKWSGLLKQKNHSFYRQLFVAVGEKSTEKILHDDHETKVSSESSYKFDSKKFFSESFKEQIKIINSFTCEIIANALKIQISDVSSDSSVIDLGFDSLTAVDVQTVIEEDLGIRISVADFFELDQISQITKLILEKLLGKSELAGSSATKPDIESNQRVNKEETLWEEGEI